jgi:hypothetical protein
MNNFTKILIALLLCLPAVSWGQITITASDIPVVGDTLRYSFASPVGAIISPADSGANVNWNYPLTPLTQAIDTYQTALSVNPLYVLIGPSAFGYKVADSFPIPGGILPVSIQQVYTFFEVKTGPPARYQAQAFAAIISGFPTPINYSKPDAWYFFPLDYSLNRTDSSQYKLNIALPGIGGLKQMGYRKTRVDGWGAITTPYYTTPVNCIRVRSEIHEIDSLSISLLGTTIGFPRNSVEYKWLVNGDHYPALWVTANVLPGGGGENISNIRYRDVYHDTTTVNQVASVHPKMMAIGASPNPAANGQLTLDIPADWQNFEVEIYDLRSKEVARFKNQRSINIASLPAGNYVGRVTAGANSGYIMIVR